MDDNEETSSYGDSPRENIDPQTTRIECSCGFLVVGTDESYNAQAFDIHNCPNAVYEEPAPWYSYIFSFWTFLIVVAILIGIINIVRK